MHLEKPEISPVCEIPEWHTRGGKETEKLQVHMVAVKQGSSQTQDWHLSGGCTADKKITAQPL